VPNPVATWTKVRQDPKNSVYHCHLGLALLESGDKAKATSELESALAKQTSPEDERKLKDLLNSIRG